MSPGVAIEEDESGGGGGGGTAGVSMMPANAVTVNTRINATAEVSCLSFFMIFLLKRKVICLQGAAKLASGKPSEDMS